MHKPSIRPLKGYDWKLACDYLNLNDDQHDSCVVFFEDMALEEADLEDGDEF